MSQRRGRRSSPRRVLFPTQEHKSCELCHGCHTHTSSPNQWNSSQAHEFVKSLGVCEDGVVCRPCRKDVSKTVADPSHIPRWNKTRSNCCILDCSEQVYASTKAGIYIVRKQLQLYYKHRNCNIKKSQFQHHCVAITIIWFIICYSLPARQTVLCVSYRSGIHSQGHAHSLTL